MLFTKGGAKRPDTLIENKGGIKCCSHTSVLKHSIYVSLQNNYGKIHEAKRAILNKRSVK